MRRLLLLILVTSVFMQTRTFAQDSATSFITLNANIFNPRISFGSAKFATYGRSAYPVYGYNEEFTKPHMIGGFGLGYNMSIPFQEKLDIKPYVNLSRIRYWDAPIYERYTKEIIQTVGTSYTLRIGGLVQYQLPWNIEIGTGLAAQVLLHANSKLLYTDDVFDEKVRYYKNVTAYFPIEVQFSYQKMQFGIRYELMISNSYKKNLAPYLDERSRVLFFTIGYRVR